MTHDFRITYDGSLVLLTPMTDPASAWAWEHLPREPMFGPMHVIEPRYLGDIIRGFTEDGLTWNNLSTN